MSRLVRYPGKFPGLCICDILVDGSKLSYVGKVSSLFPHCNLLDPLTLWLPNGNPSKRRTGHDPKIDDGLSLRLDELIRLLSVINPTFHSFPFLIISFQNLPTLLYIKPRPHSFFYPIIQQVALSFNSGLLRYIERIQQVVNGWKKEAEVIAKRRLLYMRPNLPSIPSHDLSNIWIACSPAVANFVG